MTSAAALKWLYGNWPRAAAYAAVALSTFLLLRGTYNAGANSERADCEVEKRQLAEAALSAWYRRDAAGAAIEREAQAQDEAREKITRVIEKEVVRYVERKRMGRAAVASQSAAGPPRDGAGGGQCALDDDGLRLWAAAGRGELPGAAGLDDAGRTASEPAAGIGPP